MNARDIARDTVDAVDAARGMVNADAETRAYDAAITYAAERGAADGRAAGSWVIDGNTTERTARAILAGIADGDPAVLDTLPAPDLSGEWADTLTGPQLFDAALRAAGSNDTPAGIAIDAALRAGMTAYQDVCDAYDAAFSQASEDVIAAACRAMLAPID